MNRSRIPPVRITVDLGRGCLPGSSGALTSLTDHSEPHSMLGENMFSGGLPKDADEWSAMIRTNKPRNVVLGLELALGRGLNRDELLKNLCHASTRQKILPILLSASTPILRCALRGAALSTSGLFRPLLTTFVMLYNGLPPDLLHRDLSLNCHRASLVNKAEDIISGVWPFVKQCDTLAEIKAHSIQIAEDEEIEAAAEVMGIRVIHKGKNKRRKGPSQASLARTDDEVLERAGFTPPQSAMEAWSLYHNDMEQVWDDRLKIFFLHCENKEIVKYLLQRDFGIPTAPDVAALQPLKTLPPEPTPAAPATTPATPSAYPAVRPIKAAALMGELHSGDLGLWKILMANKAISQLRQMRDQATFSIVVKKIKELSGGHFSDDNAKVLVGTPSQVPIFEAKMSRDLRLIWQVDIIADGATGQDEQIIKVWAICTHSQIDKRLFDLLAVQSSQRCSVYRKHCIERSIPRNRNKAQDVTWVPLRWPIEDAAATTETFQTASTAGANLTEDDYLLLHANLALEKFTPVTKALLKSILAEDDSAVHAFALSAREQQVILHESSCIVHGRSGTGKTTSILFKMLSHQKTLQPGTAALGSHALRQIFTTQSAVLASKVREYYERLSTTLTFGQLSNKEAKYLVDQRRKQMQDGPVLVDADDEEAALSSLPRKYSELQDSHFPLFITFNALSNLLEAEYGCSSIPMIMSKEQRRAMLRHRNATQQVGTIEDLMAAQEESETKGDDGPTKSGALAIDREEQLLRLVNLPVFVEAYWPHFDQRLTKDLDASMVHGEILGVIKGSGEALQTEKGHLSRQQYLEYSERKQGTFSRQRDRIYSIFEVYQRMKAIRGGYDNAERTYAIFQAMRDSQTSPARVDFFFVDECQDNLISDTFLMKKLCTNPKGFLWAGDVAQQISACTGFRFEDLGAAFYQAERSDSLVVAGKRPPVQPVVFSLSTNYRSHGGITNCADSVISLISRFFASSIDVMDKEKGLVDGPKPVLFDGWSGEDVEVEHFVFGETQQDGQIEFGAEQVFLVRHEDARKALRTRIGDIGLIMTIGEAKGLEFSDVLIWDFFSDGVASNKDWRLVLNGTQDPAPSFDEDRHAILGSELKNLYVAITRARNHIWVFDRDTEALAPMRLYWEHSALISVCRPGDPVPSIAAASESSRWEPVGRQMFERKLFKHAASCFTRAGSYQQAKIATAYHARQHARSLGQKDIRVRDKEAAFLEAAELFQRCAHNTTGAQAQSLWRITAECFLKSGSSYLRKAGIAWQHYGDYEAAARNFRSAGAFDLLEAIVLDHPNKIHARTRDAIRDVCRLQHLRTERFKEARRLFDSDKELCDYASDFIADSSHRKLLERLSRFGEAAEIAAQEGETKAAIELFLKADQPCKARQVILSELRNLFPLGGNVDVVKDKAVELLQLVEPIRASTLNLDGPDEIDVFSAIISTDPERLAINAGNYQSTKPSLALLCLDHVFRTPIPWDKDAQTRQKSLESLQAYIGLIRELIGRDDNAESMLQLLGIDPKPERGHFDNSAEARIAQHSPLRSERGQYFPSAPIRNIGEDPVVGLQQAIDAGRLYLAHRLQTRLIEAHNSVHTLPAFRPFCNAAILEGRCRWQGCKDEHPPTRVTTEVYSSKFQSVAEFFLVFSHLDHLQRRFRTKEDVAKRILEHWDKTFTHLLYPAATDAGGPSGLRIDFPQWKLILDHRRRKIEEALYDLTPNANNGHRIPFIRRLSRLTLLACDLGPERWLQYHNDLTACQISNSDQGLARSGRGLAQDLFGCQAAALGGAVTYRSMWIGVEFWKHLLNNNLEIDLMSAIPFLERLGSIIMITMCPWSENDTGLHGLTLPQSYIVYLLSLPTVQGAGDWWLVENFISVVKDLLRRVFVILVESLASARRTAPAGLTDKIWYGDNQLAKLSVRGVGAACVSRLFRLLCAIHYNMQYQKYWEEFVAFKGTLVALNLPPHMAFTHSAFTRYMNANHAGGLKAAYRDSGVADNTDARSAVDPVLQLMHASQRKPEGFEFTPLPYKSWDTLRAQLIGPDSLYYTRLPTHVRVAKTMLRPSAADFIPRAQETNDGAGNLSLEGPALIAHNPQQVPPKDVEVEDLARKYSDVEHSTAHAIQGWWLEKSKKLKEDRKDAALQTSLRRTFQAYATTELVHTAPGPLRMALLGPLPHFVIVLGHITQRLGAHRVKLRKDFGKLRHEELEEVKHQLTTANATWKSANALAKELEPAKLATTADSLESLRKTTSPIPIWYKAAVSLLPGDKLLLEAGLHCALGEKGLLKVAVKRPTRKRGKRPALNTQDEESGSEGLSDYSDASGQTTAEDAV